MDMEYDGFWMWVESLSRSLGWEDRHVATKEGHLGQDHGAHHILPGWGKHPEEPVTVQGPDLEAAHERGDRPKARIGKETGRDRSVYYDPDLPEGHLANGHLTITGESGSGKTQAMKTILADLAFSGVPALVLDFKDDYAEKGYAAKENFTVYDPTQAPLPFNPLQPAIDPQTGTANKTFHTYQLVEILGRIYNLGEIQQSSLRSAIKQVYAEAGDDIPSFDAVKAKLETMKGTGELMGHLSPIFDFGFFSDPDPQGFEEIAKGNTVIRLAQLPGNEVKNSVAEFFLMALYNYLVRLEQTHLLRQVLVLDEAWRVVQSPFLEPLMREARAFGLGVFVATQFPTDLPLTVQGSAATALYFSQSNPQQVQQIALTITGSSISHEAEQVSTIVRGMLPLQCLVDNRQYEPFVKVDARPYYARYHEAPRTSAEVKMSELPHPLERENLNQTKDPGKVEAPTRGHFASDDDLRGWPDEQYRDEMEDEGEVESNCPACGQPSSYCQGHGDIGDPDGAAVLRQHDAGDHGDCDPDGCPFSGESAFDLDECAACGGTGRFTTYDDSETRCPTCRGSGIKDNRKYAQEVAPQDYGRNICTRCGTGTTSADGTCADCKDFVDNFVRAEEQSLPERIEQAQQGWKQAAQFEDDPDYEPDDAYPWDGDPSGKKSRDCYLGNHSSCPGGRCGCDHHDIRHQYSGSCSEGDCDACAMEDCPHGCHDGSIKGQFRCGRCRGSGLTQNMEPCYLCGGKGFRGFKAAYERKTKDCISCGKRVHGNEFPLDNSNSALVADEYDMKGPDQAQCFVCANDEYMYTRGVEKAKKRWGPLPEGTPCTWCGGSGMTSTEGFADYFKKDNSGFEPCRRCGGSGDRGAKIDKTADMVPFPPGDAEEEDWMFPYSINEPFGQGRLYPRGKN